VEKEKEERKSHFVMTAKNRCFVYMTPEYEGVKSFVGEVSVM